MSEELTLYHYSCVHTARSIGKQGVLQPMPQPTWGNVDLRLVWLTDMAVPDKEALGLTSVISPCDRTAFRYTVVAAYDEAIVPFNEWIKTAHISPSVISLMTFPPKQPKRWWVSEVPVLVRRAP